MNKVFLGIVLAVCILGMLLVMLNDRLGRKSGPVASGPVAESPLDQSAENVQKLETAEARQALAPPQIEEMPAFAPGETIATPAPPAEFTPAPAPRAAEPEEVAQLPEPEPALLPPATRPTEIQTPPAREPVKDVPKPAPLPQPRQEAAPPKATPAHSITRFVVYSREKGATVRIGANSRLDYSSMTLTNPDRVVVDLPGSWKFPPNPGVPKNDLVSAVRVGQSGDKTRVVIDLKMAARKVVLVPFKSGDGVDVRVDR